MWGFVAKKTVSLVSHPPHYNSGNIEVIEGIEDWALGFHLGNVVKYIARAGRKDASKEIEDLEKAAWYLARKIELLRALKEKRKTKNNSAQQYGEAMKKEIKVVQKQGTEARERFDMDAVSNVCDFCQNTGIHACPDVVQIIDITCTKKGCVFGEREKLRAEITELKSELKTQDEANDILTRDLAELKSALAGRDAEIRSWQDVFDIEIGLVEYQRNRYNTSAKDAALIFHQRRMLCQKAAEEIPYPEALAAHPEAKEGE